jgi:hypothetical protein
MKKSFAPVALAALVALTPAPVSADDTESGDSGVVNGASVSDFLGSGPVIDRDAMDTAAELQNRNAYLDQDPKAKPNVSPPVGSTQLAGQAGKPGQPGQSGQASSAAGGQRTTPTIAWPGDKLTNTNKKMKGSPVGRFFRTVGDLLTPNWLIDFGLGPDDDTDTGPDNDNKNY